MKKYLSTAIFLGALFTATAAQAQAQTQEDRISRTIGNLVIEAAGLSSRLDAALAEIKRLKDRYEPDGPKPEQQGEKK